MGVTVGRRVGLVALLLLTLAAGMWVGGHPSQVPPPLRDAFVDDSGGLLAEAAELVEGNYFRAVPEGELVESSLRGMVRGLRRRYEDRFSSYFSPAMLERFKEQIEGRFSGIGLAVTEVERGLRVVKVFDRSPAERAGIRVGDTIVSVNGRPIAGLGSERATSLIKGPEGTAVRIGVTRRREGEERQVRIVRAEIRVPVVESELRTVGGAQLGYLRLSAFSSGSHGAVRRAVRRLRRRGAEGLLLDLRANGGGLLDEAVLTASVFLPEGDVVVTTRSRTQGEAVYRSRDGEVQAPPVVVLIDRATASAAEIVAAALRDNAGAAIVGRRSFGKGVFQQEIPLSNGGALKLTVGEYFTPDGTNLAGNGVRPDVRAADVPETPRDEAIERALELLAARL